MLGDVFKITIGIVLFFLLYHCIVTIIVRRREFIDFFSSDDKSVKGFIDLFRKVSKDPYAKPASKFVKTQAKVVETNTNEKEYYDENGNLTTKKSFDLKIKFYVGNEAFTSFVHTDHYDDEVKIAYNVDNPYEVYLQGDAKYLEISEEEKKPLDIEFKKVFYIGLAVMLGTYILFLLVSQGPQAVLDFIAS